MSIFGLSLFIDVYYMFLQLPVVQLVPNPEDLKQPIFRSFAFEEKFETKKKQSEDSSKPSITKVKRKVVEEPDN